MKRRDALKILASGSLLTLVPNTYGILCLSDEKNKAGLTRPSGVYISWASHDELSDNVPLSEELAMMEFDALIKLKKLGAQFDYFILDMFWFDKTGGFREFKKEGWPNGPDKWLKACKENGILPGLWLPTNITGWTENPWMLIKPEWTDSACGYLDQALSLSTGGFLKYHIETMQIWYDLGVRMFKFDFADFSVTTKEAAEKLTKEQIIEKNENAWFDALKQFRQKNPEVVLLAYNGYGGDSGDTYPAFRKTVKLKWLDVFDSLYCGDPRAADVPCHNFWRSKDIYSDHMVRQYEFNGVPLDRIDNTAFMIGTTGTCYYRRKQAWKGMLILSAARGGWMNTYYGNLDLLDEQDGKWFGRVQSMFFDFQKSRSISVFGNIPGSAKPYGFAAQNSRGGLITIINPSQGIEKVEIPLQQFENVKLLFTDKGFSPEIENHTITLGPEQMALVGLGGYADSSYDLGVQDDVHIPLTIEPLDFELKHPEKGQAEMTISYSGEKDLRIIFSQVGKDDHPLRISGGAPPQGIFMSKLLSIYAVQDGKEIPLEINYDKQIWSGLSWAVAEIKSENLRIDKPVIVKYTVNDPQNRDFKIEGRIYEVAYK
jgi:hypothetical protein